MLNIFRSKKIDSEQVKAFDSAVKAINIFAMLYEWEKAKQALKEIEYKEKDSLNSILDKLDTMDDKEWINEKEKIRKIIYISRKKRT